MMGFRAIGLAPASGLLLVELVPLVDFKHGLGMSAVLLTMASRCGSGCSCGSTLMGTAVYRQYIAALFFGDADQPQQPDYHKSCKMSTSWSNANLGSLQ